MQRLFRMVLNMLGSSKMGNVKGKELTSMMRNKK